MAAAVPGATRARAAAAVLLLLGCCGPALAGGLQVRGLGEQRRGRRASERAGGRRRGFGAAGVPIASRPQAGTVPVGCPRSSPEALAARKGSRVGRTGTDSEARSPALPPRLADTPPAPPGAAPWAEPRGSGCRERRCRAAWGIRVLCSNC